MTIVILMAGRGTRTQAIDNHTPKPFLPIHGRTMIDWVIANFRFEKPSQYVFVVQKNVAERFDLDHLFGKHGIDYSVVTLDGPNEGAACSALAAKAHYKNDDLLLLNSDQFITMDMNRFREATETMGADGLILTMQAEGPKWSYVRLDDQERVVEVAEKRAISSHATVGAYWFRRGQFFIDAANEMIAANDRTNNEFYVAPVYNYMVRRNQVVRQLAIESYGAQFFGLGTAEDLLRFQANPVSQELAKGIQFP